MIIVLRRDDNNVDRERERERYIILHRNNTRKKDIDQKEKLIKTYKSVKREMIDNRFIPIYKMIGHFHKKKFIRFPVYTNYQ